MLLYLPHTSRCHSASLVAGRVHRAPRFPHLFTGVLCCAVLCCAVLPGQAHTVKLKRSVVGRSRSFDEHLQEAIRVSAIVASAKEREKSLSIKVKLGPKLPMAIPKSKAPTAVITASRSTQDRPQFSSNVASANSAALKAKKKRRKTDLKFAYPEPPKPIAVCSYGARSLYGQHGVSWHSSTRLIESLIALTTKSKAQHMAEPSAAIPIGQYLAKAASQGGADEADQHNSSRDKAPHAAGPAVDTSKSNQLTEAHYDFYLPCLKQPIIRELLPSNHVKPPYLTKTPPGEAQMEHTGDPPLQPTPVKLLSKGKSTPTSTPTHSNDKDGAASPKLTPTQLKRKASVSRDADKAKPKKPRKRKLSVSAAQAKAQNTPAQARYAPPGKAAATDVQQRANAMPATKAEQMAAQKKAVAAQNKLSASQKKIVAAASKRSNTKHPTQSKNANALQPMAASHAQAHPNYIHTVNPAQQAHAATNGHGVTASPSTSATYAASYARSPVSGAALSAAQNPAQHQLPRGGHGPSGAAQRGPTTQRAPTTLSPAQQQQLARQQQQQQQQQQQPQQPIYQQRQHPHQTNVAAARHRPAANTHHINPAATPSVALQQTTRTYMPTTSNAS